MIVGYLIGGLLIFVWATFAADLVHFALSKTGWCRDHRGRPFVELPAGMLAAAVALAVWPLLPVFLALAGVVARFLWSLARPPQLPSPIPALRRGFTTDAAYHAMHRAFPDRFFGSVTPLVDRVLATGCAVRGRRVVITGASGAFGAPFAELLLDAGASVVPLKFGAQWTYFDYSAVDAAFKDADILVLAHGAKGELAMQANCDSFLELIRRFAKATRGRTVPAEVWAVGSEIEAHPAWGNPELQVYLESKRAFARHARRIFWNDRFIYRHIVPSAFKSAMGPGLISGRLAARWAWFFISRGFRYVPVSYTGIALINWFKFLFRVHAAPPLAELEEVGTRRAE